MDFVYSNGIKDKDIVVKHVNNNWVVTRLNHVVCGCIYTDIRNYIKSLKEALTNEV